MTKRKPGAKRGRPPEMQHGTDVTIRIPESDLETVDHIAGDLGRTRSCVIRMAVKRWLKWWGRKK